MVQDAGKSSNLLLINSKTAGKKTRREASLGLTYVADWVNPAIRRKLQNFSWRPVFRKGWRKFIAPLEWPFL
jgi:hypothetical protein